MRIQIIIEISLDPGIQARIIRAMRKMGFSCQDYFMEEIGNTGRRLFAEFDGADSDHDEIRSTLYAIKGVNEIAIYAIDAA